jgi:DNA-binding transcriptional MerR regulator
MPLPSDFHFTPTVDSLDNLPAEAKALYTHGEGGKFVIDPTMAKLLDVAPLNNALTKERGVTKELQKLIAGFKALGDTPEEIREKLDALNTEDPEKKTAPDAKVLREKLKAEYDTALKTEIGKKDEHLTKMQRSLNKYLVEREAIAALAKHKGSADLLLPHVLSKVGVVEEDGEFVARVLDRDGEAASDGRGGFKSIDALVQEMRADERFARAFDASGRGGTGSRQTGGTKSKGFNGAENPVDKISRGLNSLR